MNPLQKKSVIIFFLALVFMLGLGFNVGAVPYKTYIYDYTGNQITTPHAYLPETVIDGKSLNTSLKSPSDIVSDINGKLYFSDTGNNRIICLSRDYQLTDTIDHFSLNNENSNFSGPTGLFITKDEDLYICDKQNSRIVVLNKNRTLKKIIDKPVSDSFSKDFVYRPDAVAVDDAGNVYVVAEGVTLGIICFLPSGQFVGFIGAQKVSYNPVDYLWKSLLSQAQRERMIRSIPTEYNNLTIDADGFLYATSSAINADEMKSAIDNRSFDSKFSPVKKLSLGGEDVLKRRGYFSTLGDIEYDYDALGNPKLSLIRDVALGSDGTYTLLDTKKNRFFTYTDNGDMIYAFGADGEQKGNSVLPAAICYQGKNLVVLDKELSQFTVYSRTHYGDLIHEALGLYNEYRYDECVKVWKQVLNENANFDIAYDGIGRTLLRTRQYQQAKEYFSFSNNLQGYSQSLREYRSELINQYLLVFLVSIALFIFVMIRIMKYIKNRNKSEKYRDKRNTLSGHILFGFYTNFHPFDGFWDIKNEKRGSTVAATCILAGTSGVFVLKSVWTGYLFNSNYFSKVSIISELLSLLVPMLLWVIANRAVSSLMDGGGSTTDIYVFSCYALLPYFIINLFVIPLSYVLVLEEAMFLSLLSGISVIWSAALLFTGNLVTHRYSLLKNIATIFLSILCIGIILFILLLAFHLYQTIGSFVLDIIKELTYKR